MSSDKPDDLDAYLAEQMQDPRFREAYQRRAAWTEYQTRGLPEMCPRCGGRSIGLPDLPYCNNAGWDHRETCATYRYADDGCRPCRDEMDALVGIVPPSQAVIDGGLSRINSALAAEGNPPIRLTALSNVEQNALDGDYDRP